MPTTKNARPVADGNACQPRNNSERPPRPVNITIQIRSPRSSRWSWYFEPTSRFRGRVRSRAQLARAASGRLGLPHRLHERDDHDLATLLDADLAALERLGRELDAS